MRKQTNSRLTVNVTIDLAAILRALAIMIFLLT